MLLSCSIFIEEYSILISQSPFELSNKLIKSFIGMSLAFRICKEGKEGKGGKGGNE
jgi:hypothetical protein